jgi:RNA polymerase sigma-70 factor (ECF subfamily)
MKPHEQMSDEALMSLLRDGNQNALGELVERYQTDIFRFSLHYLRDPERARDIAQETFLRVYAARARFDASRKFKPWVLCIARNLCLNDIKRRRTVQMDSLEEYASEARTSTGELFESGDHGPDRELMASERLEAVAKVLDSLDDEAREIVTLRFFERMPAKDIAEIVGSTEGAVRTKLHRILKGLRGRFGAMREEL